MARAQLHDQTGGMPGGAAGQRAALEHGHVGLTELGQVIGDTGAGNSATDNSDPGMGGERGAHETAAGNVRWEGRLSDPSAGRLLLP